MSNKQRLVLSIIDFLNQSIKDGTVKQDDQEGLEVAIQCIGEAFGVDSSDSVQVERLSVKPATLQSIFDVYLKTREKMGTSGAGASSTAAAESSAAATTSSPKPAAEDKAEAEKLKATGNSQMSAKQYDAAIESYTQAIKFDPTNAVYYSNRAAAYSSKSDHASAITDAEKALEVDPSFVRAYHRLGHAHYCLNDYKAAADAFRKGLELDPANANLKNGLQMAEARIPKEESSSSESTRSEDVSETRGGMPGLGGGMPDLAGLMNNPMMMQMAQQLMQNGGMERLMSNPSVANMMNRVQSGGGMPSMQELMSDPALRNLASQFGGMGGQT